MSNVYLVGFMGAGKTATGRIVADRLGQVFVDLDEAIETHVGMSIRAVFTSQGEGAFRQAETAVLQKMAEGSELIVATGGGAFSNPVNRQIISRSGGVSIFLDPTWKSICGRLGGAGGSRPKWIDERHARALFLRRRSDYLLADIHLQIDGSESPAEVADRVAAALPEAVCDF